MITDFFRRLVGAAYVDLWQFKARLDLKSRNAPTVPWKEFVKRLRSGLVNGAFRSPQAVSDILSSAPEMFFVKGLRRPHQLCPMARVVEARTFIEFNLAQAVGLEADHGQAALRLRDLMATADRDLRKDFRGSMTTRKGFFWCAPAHALDEIETEPDAPDAIRDALGLGHWRGADVMVRIDIPEDRLAGKQVRAPTTLDASDNVFFVPAATQDGYGCTMNLRHHGDGVPEVVVEAIPFDEEFSARALGRPVTPVPPVTETDVAALCQSRGRTP